MGKTADLAMVQKTIIDTIHKEEKTASLRKLSSKADLNTWESFTRSRMKLESAHQESPRSDVFRKRATKPLLKQKQHQKHLTWAKETMNWTVAEVWRKTGEAQNPSCLKSSVKFPQSVMIWGIVTSPGVGLCFIESKVNAAVYQEILEHFMLPSPDKLYRDADFLFQQDFSTCPQCQNHFQVVC
ncbi:Transposable element Tcb1 transposase [Labeo rohita]|uniref:Transposable element Tcb1 transposase n=1 Tax=Labeo rohita TaxID=84645 RepID=A0ABQ8MGD4_LABRO|nr:Transposable element Tcb1 transposase [Labeo rohita]